MSTNENMRVFLAGASGVIGVQLIPRLVAAGHVVGRMTRSPRKMDLLVDLGAEAILCDVFEREALVLAVREFEPDVILDELTDLPDDVTQIGALAERNARIRTEGTQNLIAAARRSGSPKILGQSVACSCRTGLMPWRSPSWSAPSSPRAASCCATGSSTAPGRTTRSGSPASRRSPSNELPNAPWPWPAGRADGDRRHHRLTGTASTSGRPRGGHAWRSISASTSAGDGRRASRAGAITMVAATIEAHTVRSPRPRRADRWRSPRAAGAG